MPRRKQPETLFNHAMDVSVDVFLCKWGNNSINYNLYLDSYLLLPPSVLDLLINKIVEKYVSIKRTGSYIGALSELLGCILVNRLRFLNLKPLMYHDSVLDSEISQFENMLLRTVPYMNNLVSISLKTCGKRINTLPICSDNIMKEIGASCPQLKSLDIANTHVTDVGLSYLIPGPDHCGCPLLKKLFLFESYATIDGVAHLLLNLQNIMFVGYKETGLAVLKLRQDKYNVKLNLMHINNTGCSSSSCWDMNRLIYSGKLSRIVCDMAPYVSELKIRVLDQYLRRVVLGPNVNNLHIIFSLENLDPTGTNFMNLLSKYGHQLTTLSIYCSTIYVSQIMSIGEYCKNLTTLIIKCNHITDDCQLYNRHMTNYSDNFLNLENLFVKVRHSSLLNYDREHFSDTVIKCLSFIVFSTKALKDFYLCFNCEFLTDSWVERFINLINKNSLETFLIEVPYFCFAPASLNLTMSSVDLLMASCPNLETIGNLFVWCVSVEEMKELVRQRKLNNQSMNIIYRQVDFENAQV